MVASELGSFLQKKDKNGLLVAQWATKTDKKGVANCKWCDCNVDFKQGGRCLTRHSETPKHVNNCPKEPSAISQLTINESLMGKRAMEVKEQEERKRTQEFEIDLTRALGNHKITNRFLNCLQSILKKHAGDSLVIKRMSLQKTKGDYMATHGIGKTYQDETINLLKTCDSFSIGFDESEFNKTSELEILVKISHKDNGIQLRHYKTLELESGTGAETITDTVLGEFDSDGIDYRKKLIAPMSDGCPTMEGKKSGVKKRMKDLIGDMIDVGACNGHHIANALKHGADAFDKDVKEGFKIKTCKKYR